MKQAFTLASFALVLLFSGCISPTPPSLPSPPAQSAEKIEWWKELGDAHLNQLAADALKESLSLQMAKQRVLQAYALSQNKQATLLPSLGYSSSATLKDEFKGVESNQDLYTANLTASYEVDIFGKKSDIRDAATASYKASLESLHVSSISLVAELANSWYTLGYKSQSLALLEEQLSVALKILRITELKHESGKNSITDIWQQKQYVSSLKAQKISLEGDIEAQKRALNLLLGRSVLSDIGVAKEAKLITLPLVPEVGIPAFALTQRPDVKQAYYNLEAANASLAEAIKNQYPSLNLSFIVGSTSSVTQFSNLLDTILGTAVASLSGTLFDGGAKEALVKQANFISKERSLNYKQALLQAFYEVQDALEKEKNTLIYLNHLNERILLSKATFERQLEKYRFGVVEYLSVVTAEQSLHELEQSYLTKQLELIKYRISLHRALSGGFLSFDISHEWSRDDN